MSSTTDQESHLRQLRSKEKLKLKWKKHKKYFGKRRLNSISQVEYFSGSNLVWDSSQFEIESAIMTENSSRFMLAYSYPLLQSPLRQKYDLCGENQDAKELLEHTAAIEEDDLSYCLFLIKTMRL